MQSFGQDVVRLARNLRKKYSQIENASTTSKVSHRTAVYSKYYVGIPIILAYIDDAGNISNNSNTTTIFYVNRNILHSYIQYFMCMST